MTTSSRIAVDAMGGDEGIAVMLAGVAAARRRYEGIQFYLVGDEAQIREGLKTHPNLTAASCESSLGGPEAPIEASRLEY